MLFICFFFKQKTAYDMRISDWSSDVCSSDLGATLVKLRGYAARWKGPPTGPLRGIAEYVGRCLPEAPRHGWDPRRIAPCGAPDIAGLQHNPDRKSTRLNSSH